MKTRTQWWISTDEIGKPGSPKVAGPFSTSEDALAARTGMERLYGNYSVFEEVVAPPVELPEEAALGWVKTAQVGSVLGVWCTNDRNPRPEQLLNHAARSQRYRRDILAFTPATAVPTAALDKFRHLRDTRNLTNGDIDAFLAAIDKAANR